MRIAIPTSDRINLFKRTGRTKEFAIYDVNNGGFEFVEYRENPHQHHEHEEEQDHNHSHSDVLVTLKDCDALLVHTAGPHFRKDFDEANIPLYQSKQTVLKEVISLFATDILRHKRI
ncbi:MAG: hypothetical protein GQ527_01540 [Bacteroidales bacterium]|nr:hypothetical protein [Bacteroidales bacterium]